MKNKTDTRGNPWDPWGPVILLSEPVSRTIQTFTIFPTNCTRTRTALRARTTLGATAHNGEKGCGGYNTVSTPGNWQESNIGWGNTRKQATWEDDPPNTSQSTNDGTVVDGWIVYHAQHIIIRNRHNYIFFIMFCVVMNTTHGVTTTLVSLINKQSIGNDH